MKRLLDLVLSATALVALLPVLIVFTIIIWLYDLKNPFYIAERVGLSGKRFSMIKLRSMRVGADATGVDSTSNDDVRITKVGVIIRKFKFDEIPQLWNVLRGEMSLVGPRPNVPREVDLYTKAEKGLLTVRPGITDYASIVFSDEGAILEGAVDPDLLYHQIIRPRKNSLGLYYVESQCVKADFIILFATVVSIFSKSSARAILYKELLACGASSNLLDMVNRKDMAPMAPPGGRNVVTNRTKKS